MKLNRKEKLAKRLEDKAYREAWVDQSVKLVMPFQIRAIRNQRGWSQDVLGEKFRMMRNAVCRAENMEYGNLTVNTLLKLAHAFDCGLLVKFVPFSRMIDEFEDVSPAGLEVSEYNNE